MRLQWRQYQVWALLLTLAFAPNTALSHSKRSEKPLIPLPVITEHTEARVVQAKRLMRKLRAFEKARIARVKAKRIKARKLAERRRIAREKARKAAIRAAKRALSFGQRVIARARQLLGRPYCRGGEGYCLDCSGFTLLAYRAVGLILPHYSGDQPRFGTRVSNPIPGDLAWRPGHVVIVYATGLLIGARHTGVLSSIHDDYGGFTYYRMGG